MNIGKPLTRAAGWASRNPKAMIGAGIVGGALAARPFEGAGTAMQEDLLGHPNAIRAMVNSYAVDSWQNHFDTEGETASLRRAQSGYGRHAVDGSLVFGMYNSRVGG